MGALQIECYCTETQMTALLKAVTDHLYNSDCMEVSDFDCVIGGVRVCAVFDAYLDTVVLNSAEVLDSDWDVLYEDTAVLASRLRAVLRDFNRYNTSARSQAYQIRDDEMHAW